MAVKSGSMATVVLTARVSSIVFALMVTNGAFVVTYVACVLLARAPSLPVAVVALLGRFDMDGELTFPATYNALLLLSVAALSLTISRASKHADERSAKWWLALAVIFVLAALDEAIAIHEITVAPVQRAFQIAEGPFLFAWVVPGLAILVILVLVFLRFFIALPAPTRSRVAVAAVVYVGGAFGVEMVAAAFVYELADPGTGASLSLDLIAGMEELLEMVGATLLIRALLLHLRDFTQTGGLPAVALR